MTGGWIQREALVTVKAYPNPSTKYRETVCVAAITREDGWIRIYPLDYRSMPKPKQFKKYQVIRLKLRKHPKDPRPESYRPDENSLEILDFKAAWAARWEWIEPTVSASMCEIQALQKSTGKSLGVFLPASVDDLLIEHVDSEWSGGKKDSVDQLRLFDQRSKRLEKIPLRFKFRYTCSNPNCKGHLQSILDWELMQLYRNVRDSGTPKSNISSRVRRKYLEEVCGTDKETYFFVGNHNRYPHDFMVLGIFWPPAVRGGLFR